MRLFGRECLRRGQLKNVIDEAREEGVCKSAADFVRGLDTEFDEEAEDSKIIEKAVRWAAIKKKVLSWF